MSSLLRLRVWWLLLACLAWLVFSDRGRCESASRPLLAPQLRRQLTPYLEDLCHWTLTLDVGSGALKNTRDTPWSIFINGNFARVLVAGSKITKNRDYLTEALRWCDTLVGQQQFVATSKGEQGGYWGDRGPNGNIYLADAGTAATALAVGCRHAPPERQRRYLEAMERFIRFIHDGCSEDPQHEGRVASRGWLIREGKNRGALGCGYYGGHLSMGPYTISTATNAGAFHSHLFAINQNPQLRETARGAVRWLLSVRTSEGPIPYMIDGQSPVNDWPLNTITYVSEAFIAAHLFLRDDALNQELGRELKPTVQWLLTHQNPDGSWGKPRSDDQQRSPGVVTLLAWYWRHYAADPRIAEAIEKYCRFLLNPESSKQYGVKQLVRTTGFVGLTVSELLEPESTFR